MKPPSKYRTPLTSGKIYHIYNRGNNRENLFVEARNYHYFLRLYKRYIPPIADTLAYCLLPNHFHFLVRMKFIHGGPMDFSKPFAAFFGAYSKAFNKAYNRTGRLFEGRFKRKEVTDGDYLLHLVVYIHLNPQTHGFVSDFKEWPHTSFRLFSSRKGPFMAKSLVMEMFGGLEEFDIAHQIPPRIRAGTISPDPPELEFPLF